MANTKVISLSNTKHLPNFPVLLPGRHRRCFSKHYTNLPLWLNTNEYSLLSFLVYQCSADNCFKHSTALLNKYAAAVEMCKKEYNGRHIITNVYHLRRCLLALIEQGLILNTKDKNMLMINPMLTYTCDIINRKQYELVMEKYQSASPDNITVFTDYFSKLVSDFLESKKINYVFRKK